MYGRLYYSALLVANNLIACLILSLILLGSPPTPESAHPLTEQQIITRLGLWGAGVSLFFALITLLVGAAFKKKLSFSRQYLARLFLFQLLLLVVLYTGLLFYLFKR